MEAEPASISLQA